MALRKIVQTGEECLRKQCKPVTSFDSSLAQLLDDMKETMLKHDGCGLAAPQIGVLRRVAVVNVNDIYLEMINPVVIKTKGTHTALEACLSVDGVSGYVTRPNYVKLKAQDRHGNFFEKEAKGFFSRAIFHELDHLDGVLFTDKMEEKKEADQ